MSDQRTIRIGRQTRAGFGNDPAHVIVSIIDASGFIQVTTRAPHGLTGSEGAISIVGSSVADYNGAHGFFSVDSDTTFTLTTAYTSNAVGGRWTTIG